MTRRTRGREIALQVLYQAEQNPGLDRGEIRRFIERRLRGDRKLVEFAEGLVAGVERHRPTLDALISEVAENWRLDRMAAIDRNILRLGAYEMIHCPEVPPKVAINEALELAKRYSTAQSSRFVNGILDRLQNRPAAADPDRPAEPEPEAQAEDVPSGRSVNGILDRLQNRAAAAESGPEAQAEDVAEATPPGAQAEAAADAPPPPSPEAG